jgi:thiamine biosynthesis protein ThiI
MSDDEQPRALLLRYAEIFLKGRNRAQFERRLIENIRESLRDCPGARVEVLHGRLLAWPGQEVAPRGPESLARAERAVSRVFGLVSLSPVWVVPRELPAIAQAAIAGARREAERLGGKPTFKVESRRSDKRFLPSSPELSRLVGGEIVGCLGLPVDVHQPMFTVGIEVGYEQAFIFCGSLPGPGGLPVGTGGRVELLLSGGIDSPVAGWLMQKRGCELSATYFHSPPYTGEKTKDKVIELARLLATYQQRDLRLSVVHFTETQKALREASGDGRLAVVLYRRMMMRVAERIARRREARALITGEALGQVASQTLDNLSVIDEAAGVPVLRPLISHDKQETIAIARRIDTYETSILPFDDCCSLFVPDHPETRARLESVRAAEASLDVGALADRLTEAAEQIICAP